MPRVKIEIPRLYYRPMSKDADTLSDSRFLWAVRMVRSQDNDSFRDSKTGRSGGYGFTNKEWKAICGEKKLARDPVIEDRMAYRYFVSCWHLAGILLPKATVERVAVAWEVGLEEAPDRLCCSRSSKFAQSIKRLYEREIPVD